MRKYLAILPFLTVIIFSGCFKQKVLREQEAIQIAEYIDTMNKEFDTTTLGVLYHIDSLGSGERIDIGEFVTMKYSGINLDDDAKYFVKDDSIVFLVGSQYVLDGWTEVLTHFNRGSRGIAIFPFYAAYGDKRVNTIPPYSTLVFFFYVE